MGLGHTHCIIQSWIALRATDSECLYLTTYRQMTKKKNIPHCCANYCSEFLEEELLPLPVPVHLGITHFETFLMLLPWLHEDMM